MYVPNIRPYFNQFWPNIQPTEYRRSAGISHYLVTQNIYTETHATSQYRCAKLLYRSAVTSGSPSKYRLLPNIQPTRYPVSGLTPISSQLYIRSIYFYITAQELIWMKFGRNMLICCVMKINH